jgi:hypothetical protein
MTKRADYHPFRRFGLPMLLACWMLTMFSCASDDAPSDAQDTVGVSLAFDVSVLRGGTRMSDAVTQQPNTPYLGLLNQYLYLFPFNIKGVIGSGVAPLSGNVFRPYLINETYHYYMDDKTLDFQVGTASFLCYARGGYESGDNDKSNKFKYGYIKPILESVPNTSGISFEPEKIYTEQTTVDGNVIPTVHTEATDIATYLTAIANAIPSDNRFFYEFVNQGHPIASSSKNVTKLASWAQSWADLNSVTLPERPDDFDGYPANINLPDGAAVVKWNENDNKFEPWTVTTTEVNINRLDRFIYPAELWYYANSRIKTSAKSQAENYILSDWSKVLAKYENDNAVVDVNVKSVAIKEPLSYAVGCLQIGLVANSTMSDADGKTITLSAVNNTFPLTAVFVSGQHAQAFDFTAKDDNNEQIIYDKEITGISMGTATTASLSAATPTAYTNTLVFQTKDGQNVRFALEFTNNSGQDFMGSNGIVFNGTKFYLVGTIEVPVGQTDDWKKRAFTKSYTTRGTVRISSLKQAYTYLPDLLDPRLEIGIKLIPNWILSTPTNVPL